MQKVTYTIQSPLGMHAKPAGIIVKRCNGFSSTVAIRNLDNGKKGDAKKIVSIMSLGAKEGSTIELTIQGEDENYAKSELEALLKVNL